MSDTTPEPQSAAEIPAYRNWKFWAGSLVSLAAILAVGYWAWSVFKVNPIGLTASGQTPSITTAVLTIDNSSLPGAVSAFAYSSSIHRAVDPHTDIPDRGSSWVTEYTVARGDSLSIIAEKFHLKWPSILFGNTDSLQDDPNFLKPGQVLFILPVDGAFYQWKVKDTLESVAADFSLDSDNIPTIMDAIINWPGNGINPLDPLITPGTWIIIPGGERPFKWEAPMISTGKTRTFGLGPGTCGGSYNGTPGSGNFRWPTVNQNLSGYDYDATHRGIDIYVYMGQAIYASDAGVVVFAGWSDRGYGDLVIIDHLNGFHTFYGHLSQWNVGCGQQVYAGSIVGLGGSTGNSTGPHLHFEILENGNRVDPHYYLS